MSQFVPKQAANESIFVQMSLNDLKSAQMDSICRLNESKYA